MRTHVRLSGWRVVAGIVGTAGLLGCSAILGLSPEQTSSWSAEGGSSRDGGDAAGGRDSGDGAVGPIIVEEGGVCAFDVSKFDDGCVFGP